MLCPLPEGEGERQCALLGGRICIYAPVVYRNTRRALLHRFPFGIYFQIEKTPVIVVAVMHGSRYPIVGKHASSSCPALVIPSCPKD